MRKVSLSILIILVIVALPLMAATDSFIVTTSVGEIGAIKITTADVGDPPYSSSTFNSMTSFDELAVTAGGVQTFTAYMSTISNSRSGYKVTMGATAMKSTVGQVDSYINYTVSIGSTSLTTNGATAVSDVNVLTVSSLTALTAQSSAIALNVDQTSFDQAVAGSYIGTVTFTYTAT